MRSLNVFESISLDGFYRSADGDLSWAHRGADSPDFQDWTANNASGTGGLLFGRTTYEMMVAYWPTADARKAMPAVANKMNEATKYVASRTLARAEWTHTQLLAGPLIEAVGKLKREDGPPITVLGSGSIVAQLAAADLVDGYTLVIVPVALGTGRSLFSAPSQLALRSSKTFSNGRVALTYERARG